jgi:hypothetical protein
MLTTRHSHSAGISDLRRRSFATMIRCSVGVLAALALLALPAASSANYFLSKHGAEHLVRDYFHQRGFFNIGASCRPQGRAAPQAGFIYHRWTCGFAVSSDSATDACNGTVLIVGSRSSGSYYARINDRQGPDCP